MNELLQRIAICENFLIAGPIIGGVCALLSVYVVLRRMALISEGVSHAGFGGIAVAILMGYYFPVLDNPLLRVVITGIFCLLTSLLIGWVSRRKRVSEDSAIGIFLAATVAIGMMLLTFRTRLPAKIDAGGNIVSAVPPSIESLLFGQFSQVDRQDVMVLAVAAVFVFGVVFALYHQFLYTTLDEEMARINGVKTRVINTLLLMMISLVICICVRMVGFLMITALMIIPGATANLISRRFSGVLIASLLIGVLGSAAATWSAVIFPPLGRYPSGPLVVLTLFLIFAVVWAFRHFVKPKPVNPDAVAAQTEPAHPGAFGHGHSH